MTGVEHQADLGARQPPLEVRQRPAEVAPARVELQDHLEAETLQLGRHAAGIRAGVVEVRQRPVRVVADHQGHAWLGECCVAQGGAETDQEQRWQKGAEG